jgi:hypothetical protein
VRRFALALALAGAWYTVAFGVRAHFGARAYAARFVGSEALGDALVDRLAERVTGALGVSPFALLLLVSLVVATVGAIVLALVDVGARRVLPSPVRALVLAGVAIGLTASVLLSIHPLLARPDVPEGPRTWINFACEAMGYGYVNVVAYAGSLGAALVYALGPRRRALASPVIEAPARPAEAPTQAVEPPPTADPPAS